MSHIIPLEDANKYIQDYINNVISPADSGSNHRMDPNKFHGIIGGMIDAAPFKSLFEMEGEESPQKKSFFYDPPISIGPKDGLVCWYCFDKTNPGPDKHFLAFEVYKEFSADTTENFDPEPQNEILIRARQVYTVERKPGNDKPDKVLDTHNGQNTNYFIETHAGLDDKINKGNGNNDRNAYDLIKKFNSTGPRRVPMGVETEYNKVPFGFFQYLKSEEVRKFLERPNLAGIRYYFGFDDCMDYNKIRIILVGVDEDGNNMLPTSQKSAAETGNYILQKSWPPDSSNLKK